MLDNLSIALKVFSSPIWLAWRAYQGLWWAFDDVPAPAVKSDASIPSAPGAAVQVSAVPGVKGAPAATPPAPRPKPIKELKLGFVSSTILWFPAAYLASWMHQMGWISQTGALCGTVWTMAVLWVASLVAVRHHVRTTPVKRTPMEAARSAVQAVKDAPKAAAAKAASTVRVLATMPFLAKVRGLAAGAIPARFRAPANSGSPNGPLQPS